MEKITSMHQYLNEEVWKDIPDYEGFYQVSDLGRVRRLMSTIKTKRGSRTIKGRILKLTFDKNKYLSVGLSNNGIVKVYKVHRLVLSIFSTYSNLYVDHINGIRDDNRLINLRYCTNRQNSTFYFLNKETTSSYIGVFKSSKNRWRASIRVNGKQYNLGNYSSELEASEVYKEALYNWEKYKTVPDFKKIKDVTMIQGITFKKVSCRWQSTYKGKYIGIFKSREDAITAQEKFKKDNNG